MKFGTILYRRGVDLLVSLSWALSTNSPFDDTTVKHITPTAKQSDKLAILHNAGHMLNDLIHEEINSNPLQGEITHCYLTLMVNLKTSTHYFLTL